MDMKANPLSQAYIRAIASVVRPDDSCAAGDVSGPQKWRLKQEIACAHQGDRAFRFDRHRTGRYAPSER